MFLRHNTAFRMHSRFKAQGGEMQNKPINPIRRLSHRHECGWASSWYVSDDGQWQPIADVANDFPNINPFSQAPKDMEIAFRHLGMVKVSSSQFHIAITWDLVHADLKALESVIAYLFNISDHRKVRLNFFHAGWCHETFQHAAEAMRRIIQLQAFRSRDPQLGIFMRRHSPEEAKERSPMMAHYINHWERERSQFDPSQRRVRSFLLPCVQLMTHDRTGNYVFRHIGSNTMVAQMFGESWRRDVLGTAINQSHADSEFEDSVCTAYEESLETQAPYHDHIRALVIRKHADPIWISYQRLILPYRGPAGQPFVGVVVVPDQNISIPLFNSPTLGLSTGRGPSK